LNLLIFSKFEFTENQEGSLKNSVTSLHVQITTALLQTPIMHAWVQLLSPILIMTI